MYRTDFCDCDFYLISYSVAGRKLRVPGWTLQSMIIFFKLTLYLLCLLLLTDVIHYLDTSVAYRRTNLLRRHFNCQ